MNLPPEEVLLFTELYEELVLYANSRLRFLPEIRNARDLSGSTAAFARVRNALFDRPALIDDFVAENPSHLTEAELNEVRNWRYAVRGRFFIVRLLKHYAVFLDENPTAQAYAVLALNSPLPKVLPKSPPPYFVETVLLPFRGRIIYDGLIFAYRITFGPGIRRDLNETYMRLKERGQIRHSLLPSTAEAPAGTASAAPGRKRRQSATMSTDEMLAALNDLERTAERLRRAESPLPNRAFGLLRAVTALARAAVVDPDGSHEVYLMLRRTNTALSQFERTLHRLDD